MKMVVSALFLVGGCVLPVPDVASEDTCNRGSFLNLLGTNIAAVTLPVSPDVRAFAETDLITQDFRETRANLVYDDNGTIIRIYCG